jgi:transposase
MLLLELSIYISCNPIGFLLSKLNGIIGVILHHFVVLSIKKRGSDRMKSQNGTYSLT